MNKIKISDGLSSSVNQCQWSRQWTSSSLFQSWKPVIAIALTHGSRQTVADPGGRGPPPIDLTNFCINVKSNTRMHQNPPFSGKNSIFFLGRGHSPLPRPLPLDRPPPLWNSGSATDDRDAVSRGAAAYTDWPVRPTYQDYGPEPDPKRQWSMTAELQYRRCWPGYRCLITNSVAHDYVKLLPVKRLCIHLYGFIHLSDIH